MPPGLEEKYFSPLHTNSYLNKTKWNWYAEFLNVMDEPSLWQFDNEEVYRFLWLRTFHQPIAIRLEQQNDLYLLVAKGLDGYSGYHPGKISKDTSKIIGHEKVKPFLVLLQNAGYWELSNEVDEHILDGALWILEAYRNNKYHVVSRNSPSKDGVDTAFRESCIYLLRLADIEIAPSEIY